MIEKRTVLFALSVAINIMLICFHYTQNDFKIHKFYVPEDVNINEIVICLSAYWLCLEDSDGVVQMSK